MSQYTRRTLADMSFIVLLSVIVGFTIIEHGFYSIVSYVALIFVFSTAALLAWFNE